MASTSRTTLDTEEAGNMIHEEGGTGQEHVPIDEESDEYLQKCLNDANEIKKEATDHFKSGDWNQAIATYTSALATLPRRPPPPIPPKDPDEPDDRGDSESENTKSKGKEQADPKAVPLIGLKLECAKARSILNANIGACHLKLEQYKEAVAACTEALTDDPTYVKALQRRAHCNERLGTWSSLSSAQEDYNTVLKIIPQDSPQKAQTERALSSLKPRLEEAQKRETAEMLDKLKGFGNSILGKFGLSTDNFKFEPNGDGGYNLNFGK